MDITTVTGASTYAQSKTATDVQTAVAKKTLDAQKADGAAALKLLAAATGVGQSVDTHG